MKATAFEFRFRFLFGVIIYVLGFNDKMTDQKLGNLWIVSNDGKRTEKVQIAAAGDKFVARRQGEEALYQLEPSVVKDLRDAAAGVAEQQSAPAPAGKK